MVYEKYYRNVMYGLMGAIVSGLIALGVLFFLMNHRPLPTFMAEQSDGHTMELAAFESPNLLSSVLLRWASKAATTAYTFDFVNFENEILQARPYFTDAGWSDFRAAIGKVVATVKQNQLFVTGVVSGDPVIANQGPLPGEDYVWRVQIPFLVTYQSANATDQADYIVVASIVRVPTSINPQGIGIDQFMMVNPHAGP